MERFTSGYCHYVYDVTLCDGSKVVARIQHPNRPGAIKGALYWSEKLRPLGVPLPRILAHDIPGDIIGHPAILLERLPGTDLANVYVDLTLRQKRDLAGEMIRIRRAMDGMPLGTGYGFSYGHETGRLLHDWPAVLRASIERSRKRIIEVGIVNQNFADLMFQRMELLSDNLAGVQPRPFMDDATTKNVLIHEGRLSGIVDVDELCFGDPLFNVALTHTALLSMRANTSYTEHWLQLLEVGADDPIFEFYVGVFLLDFLSEIGQTFNREEPKYLDQERRQYLEQLLSGYLAANGS